MLRSTLLAALLLWTVPACADNLWITPPKKYVHKFNGKLLVYRGPWYVVWPRCFMTPVYGCAFPGNRTCTIYLWDKYVSYRTLYYHELAHCNGWPIFHPSK